MRSLTHRLTMPIAWTGAVPVLLAPALCGLFGTPAGATGLLLATLLTFVVYLPMVALALNGGRPIPVDGPSPALPSYAAAAVLLLWAASAFLVAFLAGQPVCPASGCLS